MARRKALTIPDQLLDQLLAGADPRTAFDPDVLLDGLKKVLAERVLNAKIDHHLASEPGNSRNDQPAHEIPDSPCGVHGDRRACDAAHADRRSL